MLKAQLAGFFKIDVVDEHGVVRETRGWQPNLVTDFGLNAIFTVRKKPMIMVGNGTTEPKVTDKQMEGFIHLQAPDGGTWAYAGYQKENEYLYDYVVHYARFKNHTEAEKTISEIGLGLIQYWYDKDFDERLDDNYGGRWHRYSVYNEAYADWPHVDKRTANGHRSLQTRVYTHALIKGGDGSRVMPITLPAGWYLDIRYEIRRYYALEVPTGTVQLMIDGKAQAFAYKCRLQHRSAEDKPDVTPRFSQYNTVAFMNLGDDRRPETLFDMHLDDSDSNSYCAVYLYKHSLDGVARWLAPDQVAGNTGAFERLDRRRSDVHIAWAEDYVYDSLKRKFYVYAGLPTANKFKDDSIRTILLGTSIGRWFVEYTNPSSTVLMRFEDNEPTNSNTLSGQAGDASGADYTWALDGEGDETYGTFNLTEDGTWTFTRHALDVAAINNLSVNPVTLRFALIGTKEDDSETQRKEITLSLYRDKLAGLPKDETKEMRLEFEVSVGRYNGVIEART